MSDGGSPWAGVIGGAIGGLGQVIGGAISNAQNVKLAKDMAIFQANREDNAMQRRQADLKAAGLNPILAVRQGAASSGPYRPGSVQNPTQGLGQLGQAAGSAYSQQRQAQFLARTGRLSAIQNIALQEEQIVNARAQSEQIAAQTHLLRVRATREALGLARGRVEEDWAETLEGLGPVGKALGAALLGGATGLGLQGGRRLFFGPGRRPNIGPVTPEPRPTPPSNARDWKALRDAQTNWKRRLAPKSLRGLRILGGPAGAALTAAEIMSDPAIVRKINRGRPARRNPTNKRALLRKHHARRTGGPPNVTPAAKYGTSPEYLEKRYRQRKPWLKKLHGRR